MADSIRAVKLDVTSPADVEKAVATAVSSEGTCSLSTPVRNYGDVFRQAVGARRSTAILARYVTVSLNSCTKLQNQLSLRGEQLGFKLGEVCTLLGRQFLSQCQCQAQEYLAFGKLIQ
jgi:hypothetical protein